MFYYLVMTSTTPAALADDVRLEPWRSLGREVVADAELALSEVVDVPAVEMLEALGSLPAASALLLLEAIDPSGLDDRHAVLDYLRAAERIDAVTAALKARARVALAGATASVQVLDELHVETELATATRSSRYVAGMAIERARVLSTVFPAFLDALAEGEIAEAHCRTLVEKTRPVTDPVALAAIGRVLLPKARRLAPGPFAREVAAAIARFDPDAATRHVRARETRAVWTRELEDGMSYLGMIHDTPTITAIKATLDTDAHALRAQRRTAADEVRDAAAAAGQDADRAVRSSSDPAVLVSASDDSTGTLLGACRADALAARILGTTDQTGDIDWEPTPADVQVQLVIDLATLRGEADRHCLLDGQPVPAQIGRDLAGYASTFRRMVTDPVDGHLLDYGTLTYLPAPLRTYVLARDGGCRAPGCTTPRPPHGCRWTTPSRSPTGRRTRPTPAASASAHHQLKTSGYLAHRELRNPTGPATGSPRGVNASTSPPDPSSTIPPTTPDPDPPPPTRGSTVLIVQRPARAPQGSRRAVWSRRG